MAKVKSKSKKLSYIIDKIESDSSFNPDIVQLCTGFVSSGGLQQLIDEFGTDKKYEVIAGKRLDDKIPDVDANIEYYMPEVDDKLHAKFIVMTDVNSGNSEDVRVIVGSSNITQKGIDGNEELNLYIDGQDVSEFKNSRFDRIKGSKINYIEIPQANSGTNIEPIYMDSPHVLVVEDIISDSKINLIEEYAEENTSSFEFKDKNVTRYRITPESAYKDGEEDYDSLDTKLNADFKRLVEKMSKEAVFIKNGEQDGSIKLKYIGDDTERFENLKDKIKSKLPEGAKPPKKTEDKSEMFVYKKYYDRNQETAFVFSTIADFGEFGYAVVPKLSSEANENIDWKSGTVELWPHQEKWMNLFKGSSGSEPADDYEIGAPCGSGKTHFGVRAMCHESGKTVIVCPTTKICEQWVDLIDKITNIDKDSITKNYNGKHGDIESNLDNLVYVTTYYEAHSKIEELDGEFHLAIFDESHHMRGKKFGKLANGDIFSCERKLALSATSLNYLESKEEGKVNYSREFTEMNSTWNDVLNEACRNGYIEVPDVYGLKTDKYVDEKIGFKKSLENKKKKRAKVNKLDELIKNSDVEKTIVFVDEKNHAEFVNSNSKYDIRPVYSGTESRKKQNRQVLDNFRENNIDGVAMTEIGNEGVNLPDADVSIMFSWNGSDTVEGTQRLGRVMRGEPEGKSHQGSNSSEPLGIYLLNSLSEMHKMKEQIQQFKDRVGDKTMINEECSDIHDII